MSFSAIEAFSTAQEIREWTSCKTFGTIPEWLAGSLYRLGPGEWDVEINNEQVTFKHWVSLAYIV